MATQDRQASRQATPVWHLFVPKLYTTLQQGYGFADLRRDAIAGLTVAIVALPLAMALAIASGTTPDKGLLTAVIAGFLISALGGSRFQIGGPTGAFVVVVFDVIQTHGYDGLVLATLMAGAMLVIAGLARLGTWIKYIPEPVVTGFTAGIAVIIFSSQIKDLFGLTMDEVPAEFFAKWAAFWDARDTVNMANVAVAAASLALIIGLRRYAPKIPGFLVAVVGGAVVTAAFGLPIDTIGSRFGGIPATLPTPQLPEITIARVQELLPSAFTIAFLAGVESLLSAVVADGMTGRRHRSNCELVAQGVANSASALFGGMPATGADRTHGDQHPLWREIAGRRHAPRGLRAGVHAVVRPARQLHPAGQSGAGAGDRCLEHERDRPLPAPDDRSVGRPHRVAADLRPDGRGRPDGCNRGRRRAGGDPVHAPHDRGRRRSAPRGSRSSRKTRTTLAAHREVPIPSAPICPRGSKSFRCAGRCFSASPAAFPT